MHTNYAISVPKETCKKKHTVQVYSCLFDGGEQLNQLTPFAVAALYIDARTYAIGHRILRKVPSDSIDENITEV